MRATSRIARRMGRGGSVLGGHVGRQLDRRIIAKLAEGRWILTVSATNGKTTTTSLLASALATSGPVVTNSSGSNLRTGIAAALASDLRTRRAALEVDEATLGAIAAELRPKVIVLGNLSRDQLDRYGEVRIIADRWRAMFDELDRSPAGDYLVVANADDPLVVWAATPASRVTWVAVGLGWTADASICPACGHAIDHAADSTTKTSEGRQASGWACRGCDFARPDPDVDLIDDRLVLHGPDGDEQAHIRLALPGSFNLANAALAATAACAAGIPLSTALTAMADTDEVAGRYRTVDVGSHQLRLLMAKNPAGWQESLGIIQPAPIPVIVGINARIADGRDPSWLWDVAFESLAGRPVIATGDRAHDLSVRLHYAGIPHQVQPGPSLESLQRLPPGPVDVVCNYTAFSDILAALR